MAQGERIVEMHTLSTVDLISPIQAVCLSIAHKQGMQRTVATAFVSGPHCEEMHHFTNALWTAQAKGQGASVITVSNLMCYVKLVRRLTAKDLITLVLAVVQAITASAFLHTQSRGAQEVALWTG